MALDDIEQLLGWSEKSKGNFTMHAEGLTVKEFINNVLIPHLDYFVINAMRDVDPNTVNSQDYPHIQHASGTGLPLRAGVRSALKFGEKVEDEKAVEAAQEKVSRINLDGLYDPNNGTHIERLHWAIGQVDAQVSGIASLFSKVQADIDDLVRRTHEQESEREGVHRRKAAGEIENERIDRQLDAAQKELQHAESYSDRREKPDFLDYSGYALSKAAGWIPGIGRALSETLGDIGVGTKVANQKVAQSLALQDVHEKTGLVRYLKSQRVNIAEYEGKINAIQKRIDGIAASDAFKKEFMTAAKREAILETYVTHFVLIAGINNSQEIDTYCRQHTEVGNIDKFLAGFSGRLGEALSNFSYGYADSNDIAVILAETNALKAGTKLKPHEKVLKEFAEHTFKPNIGSYHPRLIGLGTKLHAERQMGRHATDQAIHALFQSEFDMSMIGREDVKHVFDYWLHRHGDYEMNDSRVATGKEQVRFAPKRVGVIPDDEEKAFVSRVKHLQSVGDERQPELSDMFLKLSAYEYFLPQNVRIGGVSNFQSHPEAPAAYPMVNQVVNSFIEKLSLTSIQDYREKVGKKLDSLIAVTFHDFFNELGMQHREDEAISSQRHRVRSSFMKSEVYPPAFDTYVRMIAKDAMGKFDLFLALYERKLAKEMESATEKDAVMLREQINAVNQLTGGKLNPEIIEPGSHEARLRARYESHTHENVRRER